MSDNIVRVLKFRLNDPSQLDQIMEELIQFEISEVTQPSTQNFEVTYFDTKNRGLHHAGYVYGISRSDDHWRATVKYSGVSENSNFVKKAQEWNIEIKSPIPDINYFRDTPIFYDLKKAQKNKELNPIFKTSFKRKKINLLYANNSWIEIAGDIGEISANGLSEPLSEIKLELKIGSMLEMLRLGTAIVKKNILFMENRTKHYRGFVLLGLNEKNDKKNTLNLNPKEKITWAIVKIMVFDIHEIMNAQENLLAQPEDPECVHQLRVKVRRLRAIFTFFSPLFNQDDYSGKKEVLGKIGLAFSGVREYDVLLEQIETITQNSIIPTNEFLNLKKELEAKRKEELNKMTDYLKTNQLLAVLLDLWVWLLEDPWMDTELLDLSIKKYAKIQLGEWSNDINKKLKKMDMKDQKSIHKVRIKSKRLRYVLEQLKSVLGDESKNSIIKFEKLQDDLGFFHDVYINRLLLEKIIEESDSANLCYEAGMISGWQTNQGNTRMNKYL
ncbi:CHAD domain-containing protein [Acetobacterium bakii]|uniref:CHAD domain-containing protein n=1 Tax=Acetobacterium bakii TaxID=52689 RepID=A0A0L6U4A5_9FIRM|nr:CHAD domain-containing protein [Acetobacterium bakii]KNZ43331.1 hypothetical protein AKG39_01100 [Acetobacterium bakii]